MTAGARGRAESEVGRESAVTARWFVVGLVLGSLLAPLASGAQQPERIFRIGVLATTHGRPWDLFRERLRELGYVEGRTVTIQWRYVEDRMERAPALAAELGRLQPDVIVAAGSPGARAAKEVTTTIPIVMVVARDPVGLGLVATLARPGGNLTGLSIDATPDEGAKRLQLLKEVVPRSSRVAYLYNPAFFGAPVELASMQSGARALGVRLQLREVVAAQDLDSAFAAMSRDRPDAVVVQGTGLSFLLQERIVELAARSRLPAIYAFRESAEAGGLMSYGASFFDMFRRAADYVDKILKGAKPADLPVEQPTRFELVINLKTAKALGLVIPQSVLIRADHVIQ